MISLIDGTATALGYVDTLVRSLGFETAQFASAEAFLDAEILEETVCIVTEVRLPGISGLTLQRRLMGNIAHPELIFLSAHADVAMAVEAMKAGAFDFLTKPFRDQDLVDAVNSAVVKSKAEKASRSERKVIEDAYSNLSPRERQVMDRVVAGKLNKVIASEFGLSEITIKIHRREVMRKMGATSIAHLSRIAERLESPSLPHRYAA